MKRTITTVAAVVLLLPQTGWTQAATWSVGSGGNGHYYEVVAAPGGITWDSAGATATNRGGYLATCTSSNENAFVFGLASQNTNAWYVSPASGNWFGPWLGGLQPAGSAEPSGSWGWVTDETFTYQNWAAGQPNNSGGNEDRLQFVGATLATAATWNDLAQASVRFVRGYIVEYDSKPTATIRVWPVQVCWTSRTNTLYAVQYSSTLSTNAWMDLFTHVPGNGSTNCIADPVPIGEPQRYYRVKIE